MGRPEIANPKSTIFVEAPQVIYPDFYSSRSCSLGVARRGVAECPICLLDAEMGGGRSVAAPPGYVWAVCLLVSLEHSIASGDASWDALTSEQVCFWMSLSGCDGILYCLHNA